MTRGRVRTAGGRARRGALLTALVCALLATVVEASAQGLTGLRRVSLAVDLQYPIDTLSVEDLLARLEDGLRQAEPAMSVNESATDRLRLVVSVRPVSGDHAARLLAAVLRHVRHRPRHARTGAPGQCPWRATPLPGDCVAGGANRHRAVGNGGDGGHAAHRRPDRGVAGCAPAGPLSRRTRARQPLISPRIPRRGSIASRRDPHRGRDFRAPRRPREPGHRAR